MTSIKTLTVTTMSALALFSASHALADGGITPHYTVDEKPYERYAEQLDMNDKNELHRFLNYEQREPCQNYRPAPDGFMYDGCDLVPVKVTDPEPIPVMTEPEVLVDYEIHFGFDSANINGDAASTLDMIANDINQHNPSEVTVEGHADRAGPADYNDALSQKRAMAVSNALTERGVANRVLEQQAYGEMRPAIDTDDGVALKENRRVVVEFLK